MHTIRACMERTFLLDDVLDGVRNAGVHGHARPCLSLHARLDGVHREHAYVLHHPREGACEHGVLVRQALVVMAVHAVRQKGRGGGLAGVAAAAAVCGVMCVCGCICLCGGECEGVGVIYIGVEGGGAVFGGKDRLPHVRRRRRRGRRG